ncbi:aminotransferase class V-fold PLP-dependent enzyme [Pedobacter jeongneungensis]|uniref:Aminotransferase class V-fold PLP-dependent enzyme n=1 Tax=Pedobacter jeongneungensis TaxID=947309 RepID=A0ABP8BCT3_9SPHI
MIHFNNAGASLPPDIVVDTVIDYLKEEAQKGGYETEAKYLDRINAVYGKIAGFINAETEEIALFENASAAWGTAFKGLQFEDGDEIIISEMEYVTNLIGLVDAQKAAQIKVTVIPNDENGDFSLKLLEESINAKTKLFIFTHVSSSGGSILPVEAIGELAEKHDILYLLDACQSAGQIPLDVKKIKCDMLSATGRKYLRAPRGTGFLFVKKAVQDKIRPALKDFLSAGNVSLDGYTLREDARRYELYEKNRALTLGLVAAIDYASSIGMERIWQRIESLSRLLRAKLVAITGITLRDHGLQLSGIVTFSADSLSSADIKTRLTQQGINVSIGVQQATPIYMENTGQESLVRASIHYYNTEGEINLFIQVISDILR